MDATTTVTKRKRPATDITGDAAGVPAAAAAAVEEVSDAEVEEFYAILRRMRDASRRLCGVGARPSPRAPAWRPSFSWEDFAPPPPPAQAPPQLRPDDEPVVIAAAAAKDGAAGDAAPLAGLDLNAEPEPEAPTAPATRVPA